MKWTPCPQQLSELAFRIAEEGLAPVEVEVAEVAAEARRRALVPGAVAALADPTTVEVVRQRAFGLVAAALAAAFTEGATPRPADERPQIAPNSTAPAAKPPTAVPSSGVDQRLDPLGDLGQHVPVAVGSNR